MDDGEPLDVDEIDYWEQAYLVVLGGVLSRDTMSELVDSAADTAKEAADRAVKDRRERLAFLKKE